MNEYPESDIEKLKQIVQVKKDISHPATELTHHLIKGKGGSFPVIVTDDFDIWISAHEYHDVFAKNNGIELTDEKALRLWFQPAEDQKYYYGRGRIRNNWPGTSFSKLWGLPPEREDECMNMVAEKIKDYFERIR
jgi:hypothetical protein